MRIVDITDGTSNTIMLVEDAGRPAWYGSKGIASEPAIGGYTPIIGAYTAAGPVPQGGGAWADPDQLHSHERFRPERVRHRHGRRVHGHTGGTLDLRQRVQQR